MPGKLLRNLIYFIIWKNLRTTDIIKKSLFSNDLVELLDIISNKEFRVDLKNEIKVNNEEKERESKILTYFMNSYKPKIDSSEQKILNYLIEDN